MRFVRHNSQHAQNGMSLVEVLVATTIASSVTLVGSTLLLTTQKQSYELMQRIELIQTLYQTLFMLKTEMRRAGYNPGVGASSTLDGAAKVLETGDDWLDFMTVSPQGDWYKTRYQRDSGTEAVDLCIQRVSIHHTKPALGNCTGHFYSVFDENQLTLSEFSVSQNAIAGQRSSLVSVQMSLSTADGMSNLSQMMMVKQRNWQ